jgi:hypothetical protein
MYGQVAHSEHAELSRRTYPAQSISVAAIKPP